MCISMPALSIFFSHILHSIQLQRLRKVSILTSLLLPSYYLREGYHPQCLIISLQTYWCVCTLTSFHNLVHKQNDLRPRKFHTSYLYTMKSPQRKFIYINLTPLSTSWHHYPIFPKNFAYIIPLPHYSITRPCCCIYLFIPWNE
jgi:hypothetical protein